MPARSFIAIDWGTTNRRHYVIGNEAYRTDGRDEFGIMAMAGRSYAAEVGAIRATHDGLPVLIAGMAGSNRGWIEAPYVDCPAGLDAVAGAILWIEPGTVGIVPGVAQRGASPDVMRGEEVQLLGAVAAGLAPDNALLCQPGTHCKWARMQGGAIAGFETAMTGELFALLRRHSLLAAQLDAPVGDGAAFREGVTDARRRSLACALFGVRAASLLGSRNDADAASYTSGLLIGADVAARPIAGTQVYIIADEQLGALYGAAVEELGGTPIPVDSHAAFAAGMAAIWSLIQ